jgi:hypothetical protein
MRIPIRPWRRVSPVASRLVITTRRGFTGLHAVAELDQRVPDPGLGRAGRDAQDAGDLGIGVPAVEGEHDGLALQVTQPVQVAFAGAAGVWRGPSAGMLI